MKRGAHFNLQAAKAMGPAPEGNLAIPVFSHGSLEVELYELKAEDRQKPHTRDEIYVIASGKGKFFDGSEVVGVSEGSFLFVPAGVDHRFVEWTEGFTVWVFFYGPAGGE